MHADKMLRSIKIACRRGGVGQIQKRLFLTSTTPAFDHPSSAEEGIICRFSFCNSFTPEDIQVRAR